MPIVAPSWPLALPASPAPVRSTMRLRYAVGYQESPFSSDGQSQDWGGRKWFLDFVLPIMKRERADAWIAWAHQMRGRQGYCRAGDWDRRIARGTWGTPLVKGAGQVGNTLAIDGVGNATTRYAGDMIQIGDDLHQLVANDTADSGGNATIVFEPALRTSPADNAPITFTNAKGLFRLTSNSVPWDSDAMAIHQMAVSLAQYP